MNLTKNFIIQTGNSELTLSEIMSFKYGNTPTDETYLKSMIIKAKEIMVMYYHEEGTKRINAELVEYVNSCNDAEELDKKNMDKLGIYH